MHLGQVIERAAEFATSSISVTTTLSAGRSACYDAKDSNRWTTSDETPHVLPAPDVYRQPQVYYSDPR
jgi:hypothetical protein